MSLLLLLVGRCCLCQRWSSREFVFGVQHVLVVVISYFSGVAPDGDAVFVCVSGSKNIDVHQYMSETKKLMARAGREYSTVIHGSKAKETRHGTVTRRG